MRHPDGRLVPLDFRLSVFPDSVPRDTAVMVLLSELVGASPAALASPSATPALRTRFADRCGSWMT